MPELKIGSPVCLCQNCGRWFSNEASYATHWRGETRGRRPPGRVVVCRDPAACGLVETDGVWHREPPRMVRGKAQATADEPIGVIP